jgi:hypothetical protein
MGRVGVVINYCSLENRFINRVVEECRHFVKFKQDIKIVRLQHLLTGEEDHDAIDFRYEDDGLESMTIITSPETIAEHGGRHYHNLCRYAGWKCMSPNVDYVLFLDADEVPDGKKFKKFLDTFKYENFNGMSFDAHWYFRSPENQATTPEETTALFKRDVLTKENFFGPHERWSMFTMNGCLRRFQIPWETEPIFHHYSWVRSKEDMLKKVAGWGHAGERDWTSLVNAEFEHEFNGTDFVHGYRYRKVKSFI